MKDGKVLMHYYCPYCEYSFDKKVRKVSGRGSGKHSGGSSQVKCPACENFIKTFGDD
jgi:hypothetical protein